MIEIVNRIKARILPYRIEGIDFVSVEDRSTWKVWHVEGTTEQQKQAIATILKTVDVSTPLQDELDTLNIRPDQVEGVLSDIASRRAQISNERSVIATDITVLSTATTLAQIRPIVNRMLTRESNALNAESQILAALDKIIRGIRKLV